MTDAGLLFKDIPEERDDLPYFLILRAGLNDHDKLISPVAPQKRRGFNLFRSLSKGIPYNGQDSVPLHMTIAVIYLLKSVYIDHHNIAGFVFAVFNPVHIAHDLATVIQLCQGINRNLHLHGLDVEKASFLLLIHSLPH